MYTLILRVIEIFEGTLQYFDGCSQSNKSLILKTNTKDQYQRIYKESIYNYWNSLLSMNSRTCSIDSHLLPSNSLILYHPLYYLQLQIINRNHTYSYIIITVQLLNTLTHHSIKPLSYTSLQIQFIQRYTMNKTLLSSLPDTEYEAQPFNTTTIHQQLQLLKAENADYKRREKALRTLNTTLAHTFATLTNSKHTKSLVSQITTIIQEVTKPPNQIVELVKEYYQNVINDLEIYYKEKMIQMEKRHQEEIEAFKTQFRASIQIQIKKQKNKPIQKENIQQQYKTSLQNTLNKGKYMSDLSVHIPKPILKNIKKHSRANSIQEGVASMCIVADSENPPGFRSHRNQNIATQLLCNNCTVAYAPIDFFSHIQTCKKEECTYLQKKDFKKTKRQKQFSADNHGGDVERLMKQKREIEEKINSLQNHRQKSKSKLKADTENNQQMFVIKSKKQNKKECQNLKQIDKDRQKQKTFNKKVHQQVSTVRLRNETHKRRTSFNKLQ